MKSKTPPPPEDFEPRFKLEDPPENPIPFVTMYQDTYVVTRVNNRKITGTTMVGHRYFTSATKKIGDDIEAWINSQAKKK